MIKLKEVAGRFNFKVEKVITYSFLKIKKEVRIKVVINLHSFFRNLFEKKKPLKKKIQVLEPFHSDKGSQIKNVFEEKNENKV